MKISLKWLNEYIDLQDYNDKLPELSQMLTSAGLEVENIENPSVHWDKVVVGKIVEFGKHPDADRLTLCQVDIGGDKPSQIVCGATNHKLGDSVAVATPGSVLPGNFKIKKSKIRGVESHGMLCSVKELGIGEDAEGILLLSDEPTPGKSFNEIYDGDVVFELNVTPNRADCLSHIGLARELATLLDRPVKLPPANFTEEAAAASDKISVELVDDKACPRYCGRVIGDVKVGPSPDWLKSRLQAVGVNSINNVVDITNYVMFEYGQPLHAFDFDLLRGGQLSISKAKAGEAFVSLDGSEISLTDADLLIRDGKGPVAMAGVVGGENSGVSEKTNTLFLESAFFTAESVRKTARFHGIETDACYRFSRGVDPSQTLNAMDRAAALFVEIAGGKVLKGSFDLYPKPVEFPAIAIQCEYVAQRLGYEVAPADFQKWMERLGCKVAAQGNALQVTPPPFRWDLALPEDLVEEYGRLVGYDHILEKLPPLVEAPTKDTPTYGHKTRVRQLLAGLGCYEAVNYAFIPEGSTAQLWGSPQVANSFGIRWEEESVTITNPLSEDYKVMRESLLPGLLNNIEHNDHHGVSLGRLFELGQGHFVDGDFQEQPRLAFAFWGEPEGLWHKKDKTFAIYSLKASVEALLKKLGCKSWQWRKIPAESCPPGLHSGQAVSLIFEGKAIGVLGSLHPLIQGQRKIRSAVALAEFDFEKLMARQPRLHKFKGVPKFPGVDRDIALLVPETLAVHEIHGQIKKSAGPLLESSQVFDLYQDKDLKAAGQRSVAFRLRFQSDKETLSDAVINKLRDDVVGHLTAKLPVESR